MVDEKGRVSRPFIREEQDEIVSLSSIDPWIYFRVGLVPFTEEPSPPMILMATDGYAASYGNEADFLKIGKDYLDMIQTQGWDTLKQQLPRILAETSTRGSGDDITLGIIKRLNFQDSVDSLKLLKSLIRQQKDENEIIRQAIESIEKELEKKN